MRPSDSPAFTDSDYIQLVQYLEGTLDAEQTATLTRRLSEQPALKDVLGRIESEWVGVRKDTPGVPEADHAVQAILARTIHQPRQSSRRHRGRYAATRPWWRGSVIAGIITAVLVPSAWWITRTTSASSQDAATLVEHTVPAGHRATIPLPDGSTVLLAPGSTIRYPRTFAATSHREVHLEGQGLFTVTHVAGAPFTVRAGGVRAQVLGTSFVVRQYADEVVAQIVVAQGRVGIGETVLGAGDVARGVDARTLTVSRDNAIAEYLAWTEGRLVFSGVLLRDAIPELERWYGMTIHVSDSALLRRRLYLTLDTETASQAATVIATAIEARSVMSNNHLTLFQQ